MAIVRRGSSHIIGTFSPHLCGTRIAQVLSGVRMMSLVRLLGFTTLGCGCVTGHYREIATNREVTYVEEKGSACSHQAHRRNHTVASSRFGMHALSAKAS
jgi:hypothetical protein